jgi:hypothetical protein
MPCAVEGPAIVCHWCDVLVADTGGGSFAVWLWGQPVTVPGIYDDSHWVVMVGWLNPVCTSLHDNPLVTASIRTCNWCTPLVMHQQE